MTVWKPDLEPTLEIHTGLSTNESGIANVKTTFRKVISAIPVFKGSSYAAVVVAG